MAEAAENAGRMIVSDAELAALVQSHFGDLEGRITVVRSLADDSAQHVSDATLAELGQIYAAALDERLGRRWRASRSFACGAYARSGADRHVAGAIPVCERPTILR